jgi:tRNA threonylcarbamoyladenosine biosynthesis protein TsaB
MIKILAIEAASDSCSVALQVNGEAIQRTELAPRMHSKLLYPMLNDLMDEAGIKPNQLDAVAFVKGPGSFTGLRIAAATAQGIGYACDIPLLGISTLQAMAQQTFEQHKAKNALCIMDARMNELYVGHYQLNKTNGLMEPTLNDQICPLDASLETLGIQTESAYGCGHGFKLEDTLDSSIKAVCSHIEAEQILQATSLLPMAQHLYNSQQTLKPEEVELVYLREQSHWKTIKEQKQLKS